MTKFQLGGRGSTSTWEGMDCMNCDLRTILTVLFSLAALCRIENISIFATRKHNNSNVEGANQTATALLTLQGAG